MAPIALSTAVFNRSVLLNEVAMVHSRPPAIPALEGVSQPGLFIGFLRQLEIFFYGNLAD
jgi:hypothetical protein